MRAASEQVSILPERLSVLPGTFVSLVTAVGYLVIPEAGVCPVRRKTWSAALIGLGWPPQYRVLGSFIYQAIQFL